MKYDHIEFNVFCQFNPICQCVYKKRNLYGSKRGCFNLNELSSEFCETICELYY